MTKWLNHGPSLGLFAPVLAELRQVRNPGAHAAVIDRSTVKRWRDQIVGISCAELLVELARTRVK